MMSLGSREMVMHSFWGSAGKGERHQQEMRRTLPCRMSLADSGPASPRVIPQPPVADHLPVITQLSENQKD